MGLYPAVQHVVASGFEGGVMPTEEEVREEKLREQVEAYVRNAKSDLLVGEHVSLDDVATYANSLIAERKAALLKNMFGHLKAEDLRMVAKIARTAGGAAAPAESAEVAAIQEIRGRGRPRKNVA